MPAVLRLPLRPGAEPYEAVAYCDTQGWTLLAKRETEHLLHFVYAAGPGQVHVVWDHAARKYFFTLTGEKAAEIAEDIRACSASRFHPLEVCTDEEALHLADTLAHPADIHYAVLIAGDRYDDRVMTWYRQAFLSPDPEVRWQTCASCGYFVDWEDHIRPLLEHARDTDQDDSVREVAALTLTTLDAHDWNRGERQLKDL